MMNHLALAYPEIKNGSVSEPFESIYGATVAYGRNQITQNGSVSIYRLIEEMRRAIVLSANPNVAAGPPSARSEPPSITPSVPQGKTPQIRASGNIIFMLIISLIIFVGFLALLLVSFPRRYRHSKREIERLKRVETKQLKRIFDEIKPGEWKT
jgi:hypothetical protein